MNSSLGDLFSFMGEGVSSFAVSHISEELVFRLFCLLLMGVLGIPLILRGFGKMLSKSSHFAPIQSYILSSTKIFLWFLFILMIADAVGIPVSSIFALLGVAGLAVSLALQNTLSNLAGGLQVLLSKPFVVGDFIDTDQGSGKVAEIGLAYSKLSTVDNKEVLIPNHLMANSKIVNHTASGKRRVDIIFPASYDAPTKTVRQAILEVCDTLPQIHQDPPPEVVLWEYADSCLQYSLRVWTSAEDYWTVHFALMEKVRESFAKHHIEIPYPHQNIHLHPAPTEQISLEKNQD